MTQKDVELKLDEEVTEVIETPTDPIDPGNTDEPKQIITLSPEELSQKIKEAVKEAEKGISQTEKNKLYDTIEILKKEKREVEEKLKAFAEEEKKKKDAQEAERLSKLTADEIRDEQIKKANLELEQMKVAFDMLKKETAQILTNKDLELYRERLISQAEGSVIPDLVAGSTKEEIDASFEKSKERFLAIRSQVEAELKDMSQHQSPPKTTVSKETPSQTKITQPQDQRTFSAEEIAGMTPEKYAKHKDDVLKQFGL